MSRFSKVAWKEGLFLKPQHLQQADRYMERTVTARTAHLTPFPWGVAEMAFDQSQLRQGRLELEMVSGIMPDGTPFEGIRFIDRFEVTEGLLTRQDVWNDIAEIKGTT